MPDDFDDEQFIAEATDAEETGSTDDDYPLDFPADRDVAVSDVGVTDLEAEVGESIERRTAREEPDVDDPDYRARDRTAIGLLASDEDDDDDEGELLGATGDDEPDATAEEAAVHVIADDDPEAP